MVDMKREYRVDRTPNIPLDVLASPEIGAAGALLVNGIVAWESVYEYPEFDDAGNVIRVRRELVSREALFGDSARTLARCPVTLHHPEELVTPENVADLGVGDADSTIEEVVIEKRGGYAAVKLAVRRADAIEALVGDGLKQLSPGYFVEYDDTPGVWIAPDGTEIPYDLKQIKREYNHIAIVDAARGGAVCSIKLDGVTVNTSVGRAMTTTPLREEHVKIDGLLALVVHADGLLKNMKRSGARDAATQAWWAAQDAVFSEIHRISELDGTEMRSAIDSFYTEFPDVVGEIATKLSALLEAMASEEEPSADSAPAFPTVEQIADAVAARINKPAVSADSGVDLDAYFRTRTALDSVASGLGVEIGSDMLATAKGVLVKLDVSAEDSTAVAVAVAAGRAAQNATRSAQLHTPTKPLADDVADIPLTYPWSRQ